MALSSCRAVEFMGCRAVQSQLVVEHVVCVEQTSWARATRQQDLWDPMLWCPTALRVRAGLSHVEASDSVVLLNDSRHSGQQYTVSLILITNGLNVCRVWGLILRLYLSWFCWVFDIARCLCYCCNYAFQSDNVFYLCGWTLVTVLPWFDERSKYSQKK